MRYTFDDYALDTQRHEFWCRDARVKLRPKVFQVLAYLLEHRDRVVSKDELLEQLWPGQFIGDGSLNACLMAVRKAVGDSGQNQRYIQTLHGRGYRFIADVFAHTEAAEPPAAVAAQSDGGARLCDTCQHPNPVRAAFCNACGAPLGLCCSRCQAENPSEARFCNACGNPMQAPFTQQAHAKWPAPGAERRQLTVMFCDLAGAAALSERLDPEAFRDVVRAYHQICADEVQAFDGYIAQYFGDGLLTYFGHPLAHEDDAQRAIHTGLRLVARVKALNLRLERERGVQLDIRVGIHTGLVVMGEVGAGAWQEQLALGHPPHLAARIQDIAAPNTVVISAATHRLAEGYFLCESLARIIHKSCAKGLESPF